MVNGIWKMENYHPHNLFSSHPPHPFTVIFIVSHYKIPPIFYFFDSFYIVFFVFFVIKHNNISYFWPNEYIRNAAYQNRLSILKCWLHTVAVNFKEGKKHYLLGTFDVMKHNFSAGWIDSFNPNWSGSFCFIKYLCNFLNTCQKVISSLKIYLLASLGGKF